MKIGLFDHIEHGEPIDPTNTCAHRHPNVPYARVIRKTADGAMAMPLAAPGNSPYVVVMRPYQEPAKIALDKALSESPVAGGE